MVSVGLSCCCTPPPNAKELGACCYTEELNGLLQPACLPDLTEEECATYNNSFFSAGLPCGRIEPCSIINLGTDGDKGIYETYIPLSRWDSAHRYTFDALSQNLFLSDDPDNIVVPANNPASKGNEACGHYQNHQPVNYFFFSTNDDSLYLAITLFDSRTNLISTQVNPNRYLEHKHEIFDFTAEAQAAGFNKNTASQIQTSDMYAGLPNLIWLDDQGNLKNLIGDSLYSKRYLRKLEYVNWSTGQGCGDPGGLRGYDLFNATTLQTTAKYSQISSKYGGRITAIYAPEDVRSGRVIQAGSYNGGAAVLPLAGQDSWDIYTPDGTNPDSQIIGSTNNPGGLDFSFSADIAEGTTYDDFLGLYNGGLGWPNFNNLNKSCWFNYSRAQARYNKVASIRNAIKIEENFFATAVLTSDGAIYTWGNPSFGGDDLLNNQKYIDIELNNRPWLYLNSENQQSETSTDYVEIIPTSRGFLGFKTYDGSNNNVTFFGSFIRPKQVSSFDGTSYDALYQDFIANGKRYEPSDVVRLNDGGAILKAFEEDSYTIVCGHNGSFPVIGNVTPPSPNLTIKKAYSAYQQNRIPYGYPGITSSLYLILWSDGTLQCISFSDTFPQKLEIAELIGPDSSNTYQTDWSRWMDEFEVNTRERIISDVNDVFLCHHSYGFGYVLNTPDLDGYNCEVIVRKNFSGNFGNRAAWDVDKIKQDAENIGGDVEDIKTDIYGGFYSNWFTGFSKIKLKDIDYVKSSLADGNTAKGPDIDCQASNISDGGYWGGKNSYGDQQAEFSTFFHKNVEENGIEIFNNERVIVGLYYNYSSSFSTINSYYTDRLIQHTRVNEIDSRTEDAGSPFFIFDYVNLHVNRLGFVLDSPGRMRNVINGTNLIPEPTQRDLRDVQVLNRDTKQGENFTTSDLAYINTFENCSPDLCIICSFPFHKCNADTGECVDCHLGTEPITGLPRCEDVGNFYPWSSASVGACYTNPCPPPAIVGCCCATYQRQTIDGPPEPIWFQQQVSTISAVLTEEGIASYLAETPGCLGGGGGTYYDGSIIRPEDITYTFTPIDPKVDGYADITELQCGAEYFDSNFVQTCGDIDITQNSVVSVDDVNFNEECGFGQASKVITLVFRKRVQGIRVNVSYEVEGLEQALLDLGCPAPQNIQGNLTFLEDDYVKEVPLLLCCELFGNFNVNYTVTGF